MITNGALITFYISIIGLVLIVIFPQISLCLIR